VFFTSCTRSVAFFSGVVFDQVKMVLPVFRPIFWKKGGVIHGKIWYVCSSSFFCQRRTAEAAGELYLQLLRVGEAAAAGKTCPRTAAAIEGDSVNIDMSLNLSTS
jgi:hypothetical protein